MNVKTIIVFLAVLLVWFNQVASAQSTIITVKLGRDQIGSVKTSQGITTMLSFSEPPVELVCGDLYDPATGKGAFVVQRSGNEVFLKPVVAKGVSNLFVKTGENGKTIYSFDLQIVPTGQAYRIVNVMNAQPGAKNTVEKTGQLLQLPLPEKINYVEMPIEKLVPVSFILPEIEIPEAPSPEQPLKEPDRSKALRLSSDTLKELAVRRVMPVYTITDNQQGIMGSVDVEVTINESGMVTSARALSGRLFLKNAAETAAQRWLFKPIKVGNTPTKAVGILSFDFQK